MKKSSVVVISMIGACVLVLTVAVKKVIDIALDMVAVDELGR